MARYRQHLPQLDSMLFLTDGDIETTLIFDDGLELPDFAAFVLFDGEAGRAALTRYFESYASVAARDRVGLVLEAATWRANEDWAGRLGYDRDKLVGINRAAVSMLEDIRARYETPSTPVVISGCIGPRGDGYRPDSLMDVATARAYLRALDEAIAARLVDRESDRSRFTFTHSWCKRCSTRSSASSSARDCTPPLVTCSRSGSPALV